MRQIVLDTETTGLEPNMGHRVIEIGAVEVINRKLTGRHFHKYINPQRSVDQGALEVHGISETFLSDKPLFEEIVGELVGFIEGADLVIHNAPFDVSFLNYEFGLLSPKPSPVDAICTVTDSLVVARRKHPGQKNNLDALCRRYQVDNSQRELHGALLDAEILADVYLLMTGGQTALFAGGQSPAQDSSEDKEAFAGGVELAQGLKVIEASTAECEAHEAFLDFVQEQGATPVWRQV